MKRAIVVSGGGSKGAFGGGVSQYLIDQGVNWDLFVGSSTGGLLVPLLAAGDMEGLKKGYTTIKQSDIFTHNPFKSKVKNGQVSFGIDLWVVLKMHLKRKNSFGDSTALRKTIKRFFTKKHYQKVKELGKQVVVCVSNITLLQTEYKSINNWKYEDFIDWLWIAGNLFPFMTLKEKKGYDYADGGIADYVPIQEAIDRGAEEIDVIMLRTEQRVRNAEKIRNSFHGLMRVLDFMQYEVSRDDIQLAKVKATGKSVKLNLYYTPRRLTNNPLIFDPESMSKWWEEGYESARKNYYRSIRIYKKAGPRLLYDGMRDTDKI